MLVTNLPALEPDISFELLPFGKEAFEFCFSVKKEALGPHICSRWPWDECYQRKIHLARMTEKPFFSISQNAVRVGTLSWLVHPDHVRFGEFFARRGLYSPARNGNQWRLEYNRWLSRKPARGIRLPAVLPRPLGRNRVGILC